MITAYMVNFYLINALLIKIFSEPDVSLIILGHHQVRSKHNRNILGTIQVSSKNMTK